MARVTNTRVMYDDVNGMMGGRPFTRQIPTGLRVIVELTEEEVALVRRYVKRFNKPSDRPFGGAWTTVAAPRYLVKVCPAGDGTADQPDRDRIARRALEEVQRHLNIVKRALQ